MGRYGSETDVSEIRSTIDIMMERTRGMILSDQERRELRREELTKRAKGFRMKFLEAPSRLEEILTAIDTEAEPDREMLYELFWVEMVKNIPEDNNILPYLGLLERLPQARHKERILQKMKGAVKQYTKQKGSHRKVIAAQERKRLAAVGISGNAVVPKLPTPTMELSRFVGELELLKQELLAK